VGDAVIDTSIGSPHSSLQRGAWITVPIVVSNNCDLGISNVNGLRIELGTGLEFRFPNGSSAWFDEPENRPFISAPNTTVGQMEGALETPRWGTRMLPVMGVDDLSIGPNVSYTHMELTFTNPAPFNSTANGTLITLRVRVLDNAPMGGTIPITITLGSAARIDGTGLGIENVQFNVQSDTVTINNVLFGDVNGDGSVNGSDVTALRLWINAGSPSGQIDEVAARISSATGRPDGSDVTALILWINAGGQPHVGHPGPPPAP
jgi:hypothetical protein